jgi:hypothetical protein
MIHLSAALLLILAAVTPALAQRPEPAPAWPDRYSGGPVLPGQVIGTSGGTVTVGTPSGPVTLPSSAVPGLRPGDRVDVQLLPSAPVAPGLPESEPGVTARAHPPLPPALPRAGLQEVPAAVSP